MNINNCIYNSIGELNYSKKFNKEVSTEVIFDDLINKDASAYNKAQRKNDDAFKSLGPNAPSSVKEAWDKASKETGVNGFGLDKNGKLTHISQLLAKQMSQILYTGRCDVLGNSKESAINAINEALHNIKNPLASNTDSNIIKHKNKEREFYESFLKYLKEI